MTLRLRQCRIVMLVRRSTFVESSNGGMAELLKLSNRRIVEWWNGGVGGIIKSSNLWDVGMVELVKSSNRGIVG